MKIKLEWKNSIPSHIYQNFIDVFDNKKTEHVIKNVFTELYLLSINNTYFFPITINDIELENSFVCSPYTAYALYSKDELKAKIPNRIINIPILTIIKIIGRLLKLGNIDRNIHVNNFLLSTNPYPDWNGEGIKELIDFLTKNFPKHAIIFRSLNEYQHTNLLDKLENADFQKIGSRQVYIYDQPYPEWLNHKNNKRDIQLIKKNKLTFINHDEMKPFLKQALSFYNDLYLKKYSTYNPQFTLDYFQRCYEKKVMVFQGYKDDQNKLKTFIGLFIIGNTITSPLVGYDRNDPLEKGLYRHAINLIFNYKFKHNLVLNLSSGASEFKRLRGGLPSIEYSMIYMKHLTFKRRFTWKVLQIFSNKIGVPLIKKYEL